MKKPLDRNKIGQFESCRDPLSLEDAIKEAERCLLCHDAPCSQGCPAGTNPGRFIRQIRFENYKGAARTIRNNNILGAVCALACPVEKLCEKNCSTKALEDPINIGGLQSFALRQAQIMSIEPLEAGTKSQGKVAVIGAGPAGMGCAAKLAKRDYEVMIFEREDNAGGVPRWTIPDFRVPREVVEHDVKNLLDLGVQIKYKAPIESMDDALALLSNGYKAVFLGIGLSEPFRLPLFKGYSNALDYVSFLKGVKTDRKNMKIAERDVAIIGGGSVALDCANTAAALGAKKVYVISLEYIDELPADEAEIMLGHFMHVIFKPSCQITNVESDNDHITMLKGNEIEWVGPDKSPNNVCKITGTEFSLKIDLVVQAVGSKLCKDECQITSGLETKGRRAIVVRDDFSTNITGLFAGGDAISGGGTVVQAVGDGKRAAISIDRAIQKGER